LHTFNAALNFCARVRVFFTTFFAGAGVRLPGPWNVALDGAPRIAGCGVGKP
jgi:hypothetical protein